MMSAHIGTAAMDPWVLLTIATGEQSLFGFCTSHHRLGGQSWVLSTPVVQLDERTGVACTRSGTLYLLGGRVAASALPDCEARVALRELSGVRHPDSGHARLWLTACKTARWLGLPAPTWSDAVGLAAFLDKHRAAYHTLRAASGPGHGGHAQRDDPGYRHTAQPPSDGSADGGVILRATRRGVPVIVAGADRSELIALAGPGPATECRDALDDWTLIAIRGLPTGTEIHALGWRTALANEWITSPLTAVSLGAMAFVTRSGHAYRLATPAGARLTPALLGHLAYALRSWGFDDIRAA